MKEDIMKLRIRIADTKKSIKNIDFEAKGLILIIRNKIDPYEKLEDLESSMALHSMQKLHQLLEKRKQLQDELREYESALGGTHV